MVILQVFICIFLLCLRMISDKKIISYLLEPLYLMSFLYWTLWKKKTIFVAIKLLATRLCNVQIYFADSKHYQIYYLLYQTVQHRFIIIILLESVLPIYGTLNSRVLKILQNGNRNWTCASLTCASRVPSFHVDLVLQETPWGTL